MTVYLRFTDEAEAVKVLAAFRIVGEDKKEFWVTDSHTHSLDIVGTVYKPTGKVLLVGGMEVEQTAAVSGFHVNAKFAETPPEVLPYIITPLNPVRVFAGD